MKEARERMGGSLKISLVGERGFISCFSPDLLHVMREGSDPDKTCILFT